jgi:hypothetical protein
MTVNFAQDVGEIKDSAVLGPALRVCKANRINLALRAYEGYQFVS